MSKKSRRPNRRNRQRRQEPPDLPWNVILVGQHVGQHCTGPNCTHEGHEDLPAGVDPFADFGYTVGLFDCFGLPEIHLAAYPDGDGKPLPYQTLGATINVLAGQLVAGEFTPDSEHRVSLCEHIDVVFKLGQPGPLDAVSAFQCSDGAECIPARWRLEGSHN